MSTLATWAHFPEDDLALPSAQQSRTRFGREPWIGALCAVLVYGVLGAWIVPRYGVMTDAFARVANAFYVVFSRDPHLEAIGFVWNPLPSLLMVPLVLLKGVWPALVQEAIAANLISALFGGIGVFYVLRILRRLGLSARLRWVIAILFVLNPAILFYSVNGLTDVMMGTTLLAAVDGLWAYLEEGSFPELLLSGIWVAVGFLIRYEVVAWAAIVGVALAYGLSRLPVPAMPARRRGDWIAGLLLFWLTPLVCVVTTWLFYNWIIMGDPLYFLRSTYGNEASVATGAYAYGPMDAARHSIGGTLAYLMRQTVLFPPVAVGLIALTAFGLLGRLEHHARALILVAAAVAVPLLQVLLLYQGSSPGWLRYFLTFIPFGFILLVYGTRLVATRGRTLVSWLACLLVLATGNGATAYALLTPATPLHFEHLQSYSDAQPVIDYLNTMPTLSVLTDSFLSFPIIMRTRRPAQFIISSDRNFARILGRPFGHVDAFLVPRPVTGGTQDAINRRYPRLWQGGEPWGQLVADFPGGFHWRLYAINAMFNPYLGAYQNAIGYIRSHARPGDAVALDSFVEPDAVAYYARFGGTNLPAYSLPRPLGAQPGGLRNADSAALSQYLGGIEAGRRRLWVIYYKDKEYDPTASIRRRLALDGTGYRRIVPGSTAAQGPAAAGSDMDVQLFLYGLAPRLTAREQVRPPTLQELPALVQMSSPFAPSRLLGPGIPLLGPFLPAPRPAKSWSFPDLPLTHGHVSLTIFNPKRSPGEALIGIGNQGIIRKHVRIPAASDVEIALSSWGRDVSTAALTVQSDTEFVPMRTVVAPGRADVTYGQQGLYWFGTCFIGCQ